MNYDSYWWVVIGIGVLTYINRASVLVFFQSLSKNTKFMEALDYIPVAIFPALVMPMVFFHEGQNAWLLGKEQLVALILSSIFFYKVKNILLTILFGLGLLYVLSYLM